MSVVKSKRNKSNDEFEIILFQLVDGIDNLVEHDFYAEGMLAVKNKMFLDMRSRALEDLTDKLVFYIKIANSIYPQCIAEWEERRVAQGKAIGTCYAILLQVRYTITKTGKILKRPSRSKIVRERRRLKAFRRMYDKGQMTENNIYNCYQSWRGSVVREHNACHNIVASMDTLYQSLFPVHQEREKPSRKRMVKTINHEAETEDIKYCLTLKY